MMPLRLTAAGMCCAVGYSAPAATAAMRAGMDHFRETEFIGPQGQALIGAQLYGIDQWGPPRMGWMFQRVLAECMAAEPAMQPEQTCLILIVPEPERPGTDPRWPQEIYRVSTAQHAFHASSRIAPMGKTGLIPALELASDLLREKEVQRVMIAGVDSYFSATTISHYLDADRLLTADNDDGFIPGEAAGAVVVALPEPSRDALTITGVGQAKETAHILQDDLPNRADGLRAAIRGAVADSGTRLTDTTFHLSAIGHESFYFRETELAISRSLEHKIADYPHLMLTSSAGETGAAAGPLMLGYLAAIMPRPDGPGRRALLHLSDDAGQRAAAIVEYRHASG